MDDGDIKELIDVIQGWHEQRVNTLRDILNSGSEDKITIKHPGGELVIDGEKVLGFRAGMQVALEMFENLPFKVEPNDDEDEDEDDEPPVEPEPIPKPECFGNFS